MEAFGNEKRDFECLVLDTNAIVNTFVFIYDTYTETNTHTYNQKKKGGDIKYNDSISFIEMTISIPEHMVLIILLFV